MLFWSSDLLGNIFAQFVFHLRPSPDHYYYYYRSPRSLDELDLDERDNEMNLDEIAMSIGSKKGGTMHASELYYYLKDLMGDGEEWTESDL